MNLLDAILSALGILSSIALGVLSIRLYRLHRLLGAPLDPPIGFALLALAQASGGLSIILGGRASFTLYVATGALSAAGLVALQAPRPKNSRLSILIVPILIPLSTDIAAGLVSAGVTLRFRGPAKLLIALVSLSFFLRAAGILYLPSQLGLVLFAVGETLRAVVLTSLSFMYTVR